MKNDLVENLWLGEKFNNLEKRILTELTLKEFEKPVRERRSVRYLINRTRALKGLYKDKGF
jgi:hypothetical protein